MADFLAPHGLLRAPGIFLLRGSGGPSNNGKENGNYYIVFRV